MAIRCAGGDTDYPFRVKAPGSKVVHAAKEVYHHQSTHSTYNRDTGKYEIVKVVPARTTKDPACYGKYGVEYIQVDSSTVITCKNCLRKIAGDERVDENSCVYILQELESEYFYKKAGWKNEWVKDFRKATMYKLRKLAEDKGNRRCYKHKVNGLEISISEYRELPREKKQFYNYHEVFDAERYAVREVTMQLV